MNLPKIAKGIGIVVVIAVVGFGAITLKDIIKNPKKDLLREQAEITKEEIAKEKEMTDAIVKKKEEKSSDSLLRNNKWSVSKKDVKKNEEKQHSTLYKEEENYISYEGVSMLGDEFLLTYLFTGDQLEGILYELDSNGEERKELAEKHQSIADMINKNYVNKDYDFAKEIKWSNRRKQYSSSEWNKAIANDELKLIYGWDLKDYKTRLITTKNSDFDFLFVKSNQMADGNMYILLTPGNPGELLNIKPTLTSEQNKIKSGETVDMSQTIHEDNIDKESAKKVSDVSILRFNKNKQFVVITNNTDKNINLTGWNLTTQNKKEVFNFEDGLTIKSKEQILIYAADGKSAYNKGISRDFKWKDKEVFDKEQDGITLFNSENVKIDETK